MSEDRGETRAPGLPTGKLLGSPLLGAAAVGVLAALVYGLHGFQGELIRDDAIYAYAGQRMADGIPPYVGIFDHKGPLSPILCGLAVDLGRLFGCDDLASCRVLFYLVSILTVMCVFLLGERFIGSLRGGWLSSLTFVTFWGFGVEAASGPNAKSPMILFQLLALYLTHTRRWFWAALTGSLATLVWQPMAVFPVITLIVALVHAPPGRPRARRAGVLLAGLLLPVILVALWFAAKGALRELVEGWVTFNLVHLDRSGADLVWNVKRMVLSIGEGYARSSFLFCLGPIAIVVSAAGSLALKGGKLLRWIREDRSAALYLTFPLPFCWSLFDFQGYPDYFVFLPYAALGCGWLLSVGISGIEERFESGVPAGRVLSVVAGLALLALAGTEYFQSRSTDLLEQREWAAELIDGLDEGESVMSIGVPEAMVLAGRTNPNPFVFIVNGIDAYIAARSEGGFEGWLRDVDRSAPAVVLLGPTRGVHRQSIVDWLESSYQPSTIGEWQVYRRLP